MSSNTATGVATAASRPSVAAAANPSRATEDGSPPASGRRGPAVPSGASMPPATPSTNATPVAAACAWPGVRTTAARTPASPVYAAAVAPAVVALLLTGALGLVLAPALDRGRP